MFGTTSEWNEKRNQEVVTNPYLRLLETFILAPTDGDVTLARAKDVFTGYLDNDFKTLGTDLPGEDTEETKVDVHEMDTRRRFHNPVWFAW